MNQKFAGPEMEFARSVKAAVLGAVVVGILLIAAGTKGGAGVVSDATAAAEPVQQATPYEYFPASFPTVDAPVEPHIEAF